MDLRAPQPSSRAPTPAIAALSIERGRLGIYTHEYDDAAALLLERADLAATNEGADLGDIARGCARGMAATVEVRDDEQGVVVHLQDDDDRALVPLLAETAIRCAPSSSRISASSWRARCASTSCATSSRSPR